jgi:hypothetical protein
MKNIGSQLTIRSRKAVNPTIAIPFEIMQKVKYLVAKHPKECQWFHTVTRVEQNNSVYYELDGIYIPEQETSGAEVESSDIEVMNLYNAVKETLGFDFATATKEEIDSYNDIVTKINVWCHSHVNMNPGPSSVDHTTFDKRIKLAIDGGVTEPQIMLIFNKKNEYSSMVFDPLYDLYFTNVPVIIDYPEVDYSDIDEALKSKIKIRKPVKNKFNSIKPTRPFSSAPSGQKKTHSTQRAGGTRYSQDSWIDYFSDDYGDGHWDYLIEREEKSSFRTNQNEQYLQYVPEIDSSEVDSILSRVRAINATNNNYSAVSLLMEEIEFILGYQNYGALNALLFGDDKDIATAYLSIGLANPEDESIERLQFQQNLLEGIIEPPTLIIDAINAISKIEFADTDNQALNVLDTYLSAIK